VAENETPKSLLDRILSMETLIFLVGIMLIGSGFYTGDPMQYFFGGIIILGSIVLHFVRKKDWKKHWEEQEAMQKYHDERRRQEKEKKDGKQ
jgi:flagellar biosynthesis component FlhA